MRKRLQPLAPLESDYYGGFVEDAEANRAADSDDSSDDEVQSAMREIAGLAPREKRPSEERSEARTEVADYESAMAEGLDSAFAAAQAAWFPGLPKAMEDEPSSSSKLVKAGPKPPVPPPKSILKKAAPVAVEAETDPEKEADPALGLQDEGTASDDEFAETEGIGGAKEELLYDPGADGTDEAWVAERRRERGKSDAILNCPACMTLLTRDCQRHSEFKTQYRALFVENCAVDALSRVFCPSAQAKRAQKRARKGANAEPGDVDMEALKPNQIIPATERIPEQYKASDFFNPVQCSVCKTQVGFFEEEDEMYHFNNVLTSY